MTAPTPGETWMQREPTAISLVAMATPNMPVRSHRPMSENVVNSMPITPASPACRVACPAGTRIIRRAVGRRPAAASRVARVEPSRPLPRWDPWADQEGPVGVPEADLLRHDGLQAGGRPAPRGRGGHRAAPG